MKKINSQGFTLIELLVVVAIIGVLSSVIIISLSSARNKATDAKYKSQLTSIKVLAEKYYDEKGSYGNVCTDPTDGIYTSKYWTTLPNYASCSGTGWCYCGDSGTDSIDFSVVLKMKSKDNTYFCVDSYGAADEFTGTSPLNVGQTPTGVHSCGSR